MLLENYGKVSPTQATGYPHGQSLTWFHSMKQLRVLLLPPGWDASPSQDYPQQYVAATHFIHLGGESQGGFKFLVLKETTPWLGSGLKSLTVQSAVHRANHYTTMPPQTKEKMMGVQ